MLNINPSLKAYPEVIDFVKKNFGDYHVNYFGISRVYRDGRVHCLNSNPIWATDHLVTNKLPPAGLLNFDDIQGKQLKLAAEDYDESMGWPEGVYREARERFNIKNLLTVQSKHDDYIEVNMIDLHKSNAIDIYLNQLHLIEYFFKSIKNQFTSLIKTLEKNPIVADQKYCVIQQKRRQSKLLQEGESLLYHNDYFTQLTQRQNDVLRFLAKGARAKDIANELDISSRTVEAHLNNIKKNLGIYRTSDLIRCYWENRELTFGKDWTSIEDSLVEK